jgi:hypothetical protein
MGGAIFLQHAPDIVGRDVVALADAADAFLRIEASGQAELRDQVVQRDPGRLYNFAHGPCLP